MKIVTLVCLLASVLAHATPDKERMLSSEPMSETEIRAKCLQLDLGGNESDCTSCKVTGIEPLGDIDGSHFAIARYEYFWAPKTGLKNCLYGAVLLKRDGETFQPLWGGVAGLPPMANASNQPHIYASQFGNLIQIPLRNDGTAGTQSDGVLVWREGKLHEIDTKSYQVDIFDHLPAGITINKGLYPNFSKMTLESELWKKDDPNCCPSGGKIEAQLSIQDDELQLKSIHQSNISN
jgi:hypothetical protein